MNKYYKQKIDTYKYNKDDVKHIVDKLTSLTDKLIPVGGYRRNSPIVHDIDFICKIPLDEIIIKLELLKDNIVSLPKNIKNNRRKIKFDYKITNNIDYNNDKNKPKKTTIQIDIFYVKKEEYPFALLHYTGNYLFNIYMRNIANKKGYKLNQYGLFLLENDEINDTKTQDQLKIEKEQINNINSERNIFDFLNLEWKEPKERDIGELDHIHWNKMSTSITGGKRKNKSELKNTKNTKNTNKSKKSSSKNKTSNDKNIKHKTSKIRNIKDLSEIVNDNKKINLNDKVDLTIEHNEDNVEGGKKKKRKGGILGGIGNGLSKFMINIFGGNPHKEEDLNSEISIEIDNDVDLKKSSLSDSYVDDSRESQLSGIKHINKKRTTKPVSLTKTKKSFKSSTKSSSRSKSIKGKCDSKSGGKKKSSKKSSTKTKSSKK